MGLGPWDGYRFERPTLTETTYRGEPHDYSMGLALTFAGDTMIELIEPVEGPSSYTEHLDEHGEGLHHVAYFAFEDTEAVVEEFDEAGMPVLQSAVYGEVPYWYLDTQEQLNGVIFETARNLEAIPTLDRMRPE